jgi:hypothetical protein
MTPRAGQLTEGRLSALGAPHPDRATQGVAPGTATQVKIASGLTWMSLANNCPVKAFAPSDAMITDALGAITVPPGNTLSIVKLVVPA